MEHGFAILFFIFGGTVLLYGLLMYITGDYKMVPFRARQSAKVDDTKDYARQIGKIVMLTSLAPILSAASDYIPPLHDTPVPFLLFPVLLALLIWLGVKIVRTHLPY